MTLYLQGYQKITLGFFLAMGYESQDLLNPVLHVMSRSPILLNNTYRQEIQLKPQPETSTKLYQGHILFIYNVFHENCLGLHTTCFMLRNTCNRYLEIHIYETFTVSFLCIILSTGVPRQIICIASMSSNT